SHMTKDFLDFARLESGRERLEKVPVDVGEIVQDVVYIAESQAKERRITIIKQLAPNFSTKENTQIIGDPDRLKQVILNLVSNATKYNREHGRITITAELNSKECRVCVQDTGQGIAPDDIAHLFERFYRIPGSEQVSEGSGMGLAIANKIVEAHDGRIEVESVLGEGTSFTVCLPVTAVV
ncbi:MAG: sensor histidine kinase, partial [Anaerolineae bacterium]